MGAAAAAPSTGGKLSMYRGAGGARRQLGQGWDATPRRAGCPLCLQFVCLFRALLQSAPSKSGCTSSGCMLPSNCRRGGSKEGRLLQPHLQAQGAGTLLPQRSPPRTPSPQPAPHTSRSAAPQRRPGTNWLAHLGGVDHGDGAQQCGGHGFAHQQRILLIHLRDGGRQRGGGQA